MDTVQIYLSYPEYRSVPGEVIMNWAVDAFHNKEIADLPDNLDHAIEMLEDVGHITVRGINALVSA
jgi:hypothetical protein